MSIIDELKGDPLLDTTVTVKINSDVKAELIEFAKKHKLSLGKMVRYGLEKVMADIKESK